MATGENFFVSRSVLESIAKSLSFPCRASLGLRLHRVSTPSSPILHEIGFLIILLQGFRNALCEALACSSILFEEPSLCPTVGEVSPVANFDSEALGGVSGCQAPEESFSSLRGDFRWPHLVLIHRLRALLTPAVSPTFASASSLRISM